MPIPEDAYLNFSPEGDAQAPAPATGAPDADFTKDPYYPAYQKFRQLETGGLKDPFNQVTQSDFGPRTGPGQISPELAAEYPDADIRTDAGTFKVWKGEVVDKYLPRYKGDARLASMAWHAGVPAVDRYLQGIPGGPGEAVAGEKTLAYGEAAAPTLSQAWQLAQSDGGAPTGIPEADYLNFKPVEEVGYFTKLGRDFASGLDITPKAVGAIGAITKILPPDIAAAMIKNPIFSDPKHHIEGLEEFNKEFNEKWKAEDYLGVAELAAKNWELIPRLGAQALGTSVAPLATGAAGAVAGGAVAGPAGLIPGFAGGMALGSGVTEGGAQILEDLHKRGIDATDPHQLADALTDPVLMASTLR